MKRVLLVLIVVFAGIHLWLSDAFGQGFNIFHLWILAPFAISAASLFAKHQGKLVAHVIPLTGVLLGLLTAVVYFEAESALIYAVMPFYQMAALLIVFAVGLLITYLRKR